MHDLIQDWRLKAGCLLDDAARHDRCRGRPGRSREEGRLTSLAAGLANGSPPDGTQSVAELPHASPRHLPDRCRSPAWPA